MSPKRTRIAVVIGAVTVLLLAGLVLPIEGDSSPVQPAAGQTLQAELAVDLNRTSAGTNETAGQDTVVVDAYAYESDGSILDHQGDSDLDLVWAWISVDRVRPSDLSCWDEGNGTWLNLSKSDLPAACDLDENTFVSCGGVTEACSLDAPIPSELPPNAGQGPARIRMVVTGYEAATSAGVGNELLGGDAGFTLHPDQEPEFVTSEFGIEIDGHGGSELFQIVGFGVVLAWALSKGLFVVGLVSIPPMIDPLIDASVGPSHPFGFTFGIVAIAIALMIEFVARHRETLLFPEKPDRGGR